MHVGALASCRGANNPDVVELSKFFRCFLVLGTHLDDGGVVAQADVRGDLLHLPLLGQGPSLLPSVNFQLSSPPSSLIAMVTLVSSILGPVAKFSEITIFSTILRVLIGRAP